MPTLQNEYLTVEIKLRGAELMSVRSADGLEYLWQGDPTYWEDRAPVLFPWVGRLYDGTYRYQGRSYGMGLHGFAWKSLFAVAKQSRDAVTMVLESTPDTKRQYPFDFRFSVTYALEGRSLKVTYAVKNTGAAPMYFAWGGHPGFRVPLVAGETMADYEIVFSEACAPERVLFSDNVLVSGQKTPFPLKEGRRLQLEHRLFDHFVVVLTNMAKELTLKGTVSGKGVCVSYPDMPYLGIWHVAKTDAPYVCIEPWSSLPGREGVTEDISCRSDLLTAAPGEEKKSVWHIRVF